MGPEKRKVAREGGWMRFRRTSVLTPPGVEIGQCVRPRRAPVSTTCCEPEPGAGPPHPPGRLRPQGKSRGPGLEWGINFNIDSSLDRSVRRRRKNIMS
eukprot:4953839-Pyramimonas_sp.AAC.1